MQSRFASATRRHGDHATARDGRRWEWKNAGLTGSHCERLPDPDREGGKRWNGRSGWRRAAAGGEVETIEAGRLKRRVVGLTADEVGLTLAEGKGLLSELQRLVL